MKAVINTVLVAVCLAFVSCDSNKRKVEDMTKEFITAVNEKDNVTINELYPERKSYKQLVVAPSINTDGIDVTFNETDSLYTAKINDKQSLVFKCTGQDSLQICDSYGILQLDSVTIELAAKIGAPIKKNSDLTNGRLFADDGDLIDYLENRFSNAMNGNIIVNSDGRYNWGRNYGVFYLNYENSITNYGEKEVDCDEYDILIEFFQVNPYANLGKEIIPGFTLAPGATAVIQGSRNSLYNYAQNRNLSWKAILNFKNKSKCAMLEKYAEFSGKEYNEFLEQQSKESTQNEND